MRLFLHYNVPTDGLYYYLLGSCYVNTTNIRLRGYSVEMNPHGHLPASRYGELSFSRSMMFCFILTLGMWFYRFWSIRESFLLIHKLISIGLLSFCLYFACSSINLTILNRVGSLPSVARTLTIFLRSLSEALIRITLLIIAQGYIYEDDLISRHGSVHDMADLSTPFAIFFIIVYDLLSSSFAISLQNQDTSHSSLMIPIL